MDEVTHSPNEPEDDVRILISRKRDYDQSLGSSCVDALQIAATTSYKLNTPDYFRKLSPTSLNTLTKKPANGIKTADIGHAGVAKTVGAAAPKTRRTEEQDANAVNLPWHS